MQTLEPTIFLHATRPDTAVRIKEWADARFPTRPKAQIIHDPARLETTIAGTLQPLLIFITDQLDDSNSLLLRQLTCNEQRIQVMLCSQRDEALDAWGLEVAYFLHLPLQEAQFSRPIQRYLQHFRDERNFNGLKIKHEGTEHPVRFHDILYIKADGNYSHIHLVNGQRFVVTAQLGKMVERCTGSLLLQKVDRSLIVNIARIQAFDEKHLVFRSDKNLRIELTKGKYQDIKKLLLYFYK